MTASTQNSHPLQNALRLLDAASAENLLSAALHIPNDSDVQRPSAELQAQINAAQASGQAIALHFPKFTDGRAFSQAVLLRRRFGFTHDIVATGEVLVDQLQQMARSGFSVAVLREGQDAELGRRLLAHYPAFYQEDDAKAA